MRYNLPAQYTSSSIYDTQMPVQSSFGLSLAYLSALVGNCLRYHGSLGLGIAMKGASLVVFAVGMSLRAAIFLSDSRAL